MGVCGVLLQLFQDQKNHESDEARMVTEDDPDLILFMDHDICSSFPINDLLKEHHKNQRVLTLLGH